MRAFYFDIPLGVGAEPVAVHADWWEGCDLFGEVDRGGEGLAVSNDAVGEADAVRFVGGDGAPGEDHVEGAALADDSRQPHRSAVDQRYAPASAIDAEQDRKSTRLNSSH